MAADDRADSQVWLLPEGSGMGPLVIPTIGAVPPGAEWFLPGAPAASANAGSSPASRGVQAASSLATPTRSAGDRIEPVDQVPTSPVPTAPAVTPVSPSVDRVPASLVPTPPPVTPVPASVTAASPTTKPAAPTTPRQPAASTSTQQLPTEQTPAEELPVEEPPAAKPPAEKPAAAEPPAEKPATAVQVPGKALEVRNPATSDLVLSVTVADVQTGVSCTDPSVVAGNGSLVAVRSR
ncbi:hypothetical protein [Blastococcus sp. SYSU DS0973]